MQETNITMQCVRWVFLREGIDDLFVLICIMDNIISTTTKDILMTKFICHREATLISLNRYLKTPWFQDLGDIQVEEITI